MPSRPLLRISHILLLIHLTILLLPLGGIAALRLYESALIRQTESELISQGVILALAYRAALERQLPGASMDAYGVLRTVPEPLRAPDQPWRPYPARLDLARDAVSAPPPDALPAARAPDGLTQAAGSELQAILDEAQHLTLAGVRVLDFAATVVASTADDLGGSLSAYEEAQLALGGGQECRLRQRNSSSVPPALDSISRSTRLRVFCALPVLRGERVLGAVLLSRTPANITQTLYGKRRELALSAALLLVLMLGLSAYSARTIARPLHALGEQAHRAERGEKGAVIPLARPGVSEIAELSASISRMARVLETRAAYIRDFAAQVSHEFKTPLTAIQGAVELMRDHAAALSTTEREKFLSMIGQDAARLERLTRRLLELARADMSAPVLAACEALPVLESLCARYRERGLDVQLGAVPFARLAMSAESLDALLSNLFDNARTHGGEQVQVRLHADISGVTMILHLRDNGTGISAANVARVFEPFFTTARERGNTGLGLPIVRALLAAQGGEIALQPSSAGAHFVVQLPLAHESFHT